MTRLSSRAAVLVLLGSAVASGAEPSSHRSSAIFPYPIHKTVLDNGLTVLSVPFDSPGIIAYYTIVRAGARNEVEEGLSGFAHFFEHMMFRGTRRYPQDKYNDVLRSLGADSNAYTNQDWTCYHMTIPASALATAVEIESDRFRNLEYDEASFQKEARAVLGEYNKGASSPLLKLNEAMRGTAYTAHTYKHTTIGFLADIRDMPNQYAYSKVFFDRWYRPENCTVIVAGDVKHEELVGLVRRSYGDWARGTAPPVAIPVEPPQAAPRSSRLTWPLPTLPTLCLGYHIPAADPSNPDTAALAALGQAVFGKDSPLHRDLVLKEQKAVTLRAEAESRRDPGLFTVLVRLRDPRDLAGVRRRIAAALAEAARTPVDPARLARIQSHLRHEFAGTLQSADDVADAVGEAVAVTGRAESINARYAAYDRLTPADLQRVAARYFRPDHETAIILEAKAKTDGGAAGLARPTTLLRSPSSPLVAFRFVLRAGSRHDPPGKEGLAALTAAMVAEGGTKSLTSEQVLEAFYPLAARLEGACRKEVTVFAGVVHKDSLSRYIPLATELIAGPRFDPRDFERLRNEALDHVTKSLRANNDEDLGKWALQVELYRDHPYGHPDRGTEQGLKAITLDDVREFHRRHYSREAMNLGIAGGFDEAAHRAVEEALTHLPTAEVEAAPLPAPRSLKGLEVTIVEKPADATAISIGFPIDVTRRDDDFYALVVANSYLGEHRTFNGKLMQDLRGKRGLNYGDYSYIEDFIQEEGSAFPVPNNPRQQQDFSIWIRPVPNDKALFALRAALWELDRLVHTGMTQQEFEATRNFLLNYSKLWVQTLSRRLGYAIDGEFYGRKDLATELAERLPRLEVDQVNAAVRKHLKTGGMAVAIIAPDAAGLRALLTSGRPTPMTYDTRGTPEDVLAEDKAIAAFPLKDVSVRVVPVKQMFAR
jgi:zinc protease